MITKDDELLYPFLSAKEYRKRGVKGNDGRRDAIAWIAIKLWNADNELTDAKDYPHDDMNAQLAFIAFALKRHHVWLPPSYYTFAQAKGKTKVGELNDISFYKYLTWDMAHEVVRQVEESVKAPSMEDQSVLMNQRIFWRGLSIVNAFLDKIEKPSTTTTHLESTPTHIYEGAW